MDNSTLKVLEVRAPPAAPREDRLMNFIHCRRVAEGEPRREDAEEILESKLETERRTLELLEQGAQVIEKGRVERYEDPLHRVTGVRKKVFAQEEAPAPEPKSSEPIRLVPVEKESVEYFPGTRQMRQKLRRKDSRTKSESHYWEEVPPAPSIPPAGEMRNAWRERPGKKLFSEVMTYSLMVGVNDDLNDVYVQQALKESLITAQKERERLLACGDFEEMERRAILESLKDMGEGDEQYVNMATIDLLDKAVELEERAKTCAVPAGTTTGASGDAGLVDINDIFARILEGDRSLETYKTDLNNNRNRGRVQSFAVNYLESVPKHAFGAKRSRSASGRSVNERDLERLGFAPAKPVVDRSRPLKSSGPGGRRDLQHKLPPEDVSVRGRGKHVRFADKTDCLEETPPEWAPGIPLAQWDEENARAQPSDHVVAFSAPKDKGQILIEKTVSRSATQIDEQTKGEDKTSERFQLSEQKTELKNYPVHSSQNKSYQQDACEGGDADNPQKTEFFYRRQYNNNRKPKQGKSTRQGFQTSGRGAAEHGGQQPKDLNSNLKSQMEKETQEKRNDNPGFWDYAQVNVSASSAEARHGGYGESSQRYVKGVDEHAQTQSDGKGFQYRDKKLSDSGNFEQRSGQKKGNNSYSSNFEESFGNRSYNQRQGCKRQHDEEQPKSRGQNNEQSFEQKTENFGNTSNPVSIQSRTYNTSHGQDSNRKQSGNPNTGQFRYGEVNRRQDGNNSSFNTEQPKSFGQHHGYGNRGRFDASDQRDKQVSNNQDGRRFDHQGQDGNNTSSNTQQPRSFGQHHGYGNRGRFDTNDQRHKQVSNNQDGRRFDYQSQDDNNTGSNTQPPRSFGQHHGYGNRGRFDTNDQRHKQVSNNKDGRHFDYQSQDDDNTGSNTQQPRSFGQQHGYGNRGRFDASDQRDKQVSNNQDGRRFDRQSQDGNSNSFNTEQLKSFGEQHGYGNTGRFDANDQRHKQVSNNQDGRRFDYQSQDDDNTGSNTQQPRSFGLQHIYGNRGRFDANDQRHKQVSNNQDGHCFDHRSQDGNNTCSNTQQPRSFGQQHGYGNRGRFDASDQRDKQVSNNKDGHHFDRQIRNRSVHEDKYQCNDGDVKVGGSEYEEKSYGRDGHRENSGVGDTDSRQSYSGQGRFGAQWKDKSGNCEFESGKSYNQKQDRQGQQHRENSKNKFQHNYGSRPYKQQDDKNKDLNSSPCIPTAASVCYSQHQDAYNHRQESRNVRSNTPNNEQRSESRSYNQDKKAGSYCYGQKSREFTAVRDRRADQEEELWDSGESTEAEEEWKDHGLAGMGQMPYEKRSSRNVEVAGEVVEYCEQIPGVDANLETGNDEILCSGEEEAVKGAAETKETEEYEGETFIPYRVQPQLEEVEKKILELQGKIATMGTNDELHTDLASTAIDMNSGVWNSTPQPMVYTPQFSPNDVLQSMGIANPPTSQPTSPACTVGSASCESRPYQEQGFGFNWPTMGTTVPNTGAPMAPMTTTTGACVGMPSIIGTSTPGPAFSTSTPAMPGHYMTGMGFGNPYMNLPYGADAMGQMPEMFKAQMAAAHAAAVQQMFAPQMPAAPVSAPVSGLQMPATHLSAPLSGMQMPAPQLSGLQVPAAQGSAQLSGLQMPPAQVSAQSSGLQVPPAQVSAQSGLQMPLAQVSAQSSGLQMPQAQVSAQSSGLQMPPAQVSEQLSGLQMPPAQVSAQSSGLQMSPAQVSAQSSGLQMSPAQVSAQSSGLQMPPAQVSEQLSGLQMPPAQVSAQSSGLQMPPAQVSAQLAGMQVSGSQLTGEKVPDIQVPDTQEQETVPPMKRQPEMQMPGMKMSIMRAPGSTLQNAMVRPSQTSTFKLPDMTKPPPLLPTSTKPDSSVTDKSASVAKSSDPSEGTEGPAVASAKAKGEPADCVQMRAESKSPPATSTTPLSDVGMQTVLPQNAQPMNMQTPGVSTTAPQIPAIGDIQAAQLMVSQMQRAQIMEMQRAQIMEMQRAQMMGQQMVNTHPQFSVAGWPGTFMGAPMGTPMAHPSWPSFHTPGGCMPSLPIQPMQYMDPVRAQAMQFMQSACGPAPAAAPRMEAPPSNVTWLLSEDELNNVKACVAASSANAAKAESGPSSAAGAGDAGGLPHV